MTIRANEAEAVGQEASGQESRGTDASDATATPARRPYRAPELRRLGSVREVTWGAGSGIEGFVMGMMM